jgi:glycosyltransferase involved in cell wall biosynthesis
MQPKVTIGICARNSESAIGDIIKRILSQDFPHDDLEVIFVEEGSTDNTLGSIINQASMMKINWQVFSHNWKGLGFSRNAILKSSKCDYIVWLDDGTSISKDYIRKQVDYMEKNPVVGATTGILNPYRGMSRTAALENMSELVFSHKCAGKDITTTPGTGGSICRVKAMMQIGGFDDSISGANEDLDMFYRMLKAGWKIHVSSILYSRDYGEKLQVAWKKSVWYGYGLHFVIHKHKELKMILCRSTPIAGFIEGVLTSIIAFKLTHKKIAFLLPFYFALKRSGLYFGFLKAHFSSYGH